jgi:hypothetical protein
MFFTLALNFFILLLTGAALAQTGDPLALFALFFMHDLPVHVVTNEQQIRAAAIEKMDDEDDADGRGIGFTAKV